MRVNKITLANGKSFGTKWDQNKPWVSDIHERNDSTILTFKHGARTFRRTFANRYITKGLMQ